jgi:predicted DNA-binding protein
MKKDRGQKPQRTKTQHYVPQLILRGFTNQAGLLCCYDKVYDTTRTTSTKAAAQEPYFYEVPAVEENLIENFLRDLERTWKPMLVDLIKSADAGHITDKQILEFSPFLVLQWMRTKTMRDISRESINKHIQSMMDTTLALNNMAGQVQAGLKEEALVGVHIKQILDLDMIEKMSTCLECHYWVVGINESDHPFYTSDHPVVRRANLYDGARLMFGPRDPGIEFRATAL